MARALIGSEAMVVAAAVDTDPAKAGRDLRSVVRARSAPSVTVTGDARAALGSGCHVVIHTTGSRLAEVEPQLAMIAEAGLPCATSCEEMAFPEAADPALAGKLDRLARERGVALVGAGVNPGFAMDALALALAGASRGISHVTVERVLDPLSRRRAFQKKVGLGLTYQEASRLVEAGELGHVGLRQSAWLIARGLGWELTSMEERVRVLCEDEDPASPRRRQRPGASVSGLHQVLRAREGDRDRITLEMVMAAGVEGPHDAVTITGTPELKIWIPGGIPGDEATVSCLVNAALQAASPPRPGLLTLLDLPLRAGAVGGGARRP
ncbi:MAG TPA: dihydrodipicolinate reductase [Candidatus Polarisedimenticolia bacterium]|nr:dihydrodipicolinate reductase [Candidatus Polarisedimenticolia bacterium]